MMNTKELREQLTALKEELRTLAEVAVNEKRDWTPEEKESYTAKENEMRSLEETIAKIENVPEVEKEERKMENIENKLTTEEVEARAFENFILGKVAEMRTGEKNFDITSNGAVVPVTIAARIVQEIKDRCSILRGADVYSVKGELRIPVYGDSSNHNIAASYTDDFQGLVADAGKFTSVNLGGYLIGALTLVGKRLETNAAFNVVDFVIGEIADKMADFLENELLNGTGSSAIEGLVTGCTTNALTNATLTTDKLIETQAAVKTAYQGDAVWVMHPDMFTAVRKLKDANNRYLLQDDISQEFPWRLLGKPVELSDNMDDDVILYANYKAMAINIRENISIEVLREAYATLHAYGICAFMECDAKVVNQQMVAKLTIG